MYAYKSTERKETKKEGTKEVTTTYYECKERWVSDPEKSADGRGCRSENKINPPQKWKSNIVSTNPSIIIADKVFPSNGKIEYVNMPSIQLKQSDLINNKMYLEENKLYEDESCSKNPNIGCERLSYEGISYEPEKNYTLIGYVEGNQITPYTSKEDNKYLVMGSGEFKDTLQALGKKDTLMTWALFFLATLFFWLGSELIIGPFLELLEFIPHW